jgi:hypothetical protein
MLAKEFGMEVLGHHSGTEAGEVLALQAALFALVGRLPTPAQVVEVFEPGVGPGCRRVQGGGQNLGLAVIEGMSMDSATAPTAFWGWSPLERIILSRISV